jgi:hypothetical protein
VGKLSDQSDTSVNFRTVHSMANGGYYRHSLRQDGDNSEELSVEMVLERRKMAFVKCGLIRQGVSKWREK